MIQPNAACIAFCDWMLNVSWQHLSNSQRLIVQNVRTAAVTGSPISVNDWSNFNKFTAWRFPFYKVFRGLAVATYPSLLTNLLRSYSFEGNSIDLISGFNGVDTNVSYSLADGKILQGVATTGHLSYITFPPLTLATPGTYSFWFRTPGGIAHYLPIYSNTTYGFGSYYDGTTGKMALYDGVVIQGAQLVPLNTYVLVTVTTDSTTVRLYMNGVLQCSMPVPMLDPTFDTFGGWPIDPVPAANYDILSYWDRVLSSDEMLMYYNAGAGIQYPF